MKLGEENPSHSVAERNKSTLYVKSLARCLEEKSLSKMAAALTLPHVHFKEHLLTREHAQYIAIQKKQDIEL